MALATCLSVRHRKGGKLGLLKRSLIGSAMLKLVGCRQLLSINMGIDTICNVGVDDHCVQSARKFSALLLKNALLRRIFLSIW